MVGSVVGLVVGSVVSSVVGSVEVSPVVSSSADVVPVKNSVIPVITTLMPESEKPANVGTERTVRITRMTEIT